MIFEASRAFHYCARRSETSRFQMPMGRKKRRKRFASTSQWATRSETSRFHAHNRRITPFGDLHNSSYHTFRIFRPNNVYLLFIQNISPLAVGSEKFPFLWPIGCWKRDVSLLVSHWLLKRNVSILSSYWLLEAKHFASFCSLAAGSETFRIFRPNNVYTHFN